MSKFAELVDMTKNIKKEKARYAAIEARAAALPKTYNFVFKQIEKHLWEASDFSGRGMMSAMEDLLMVFEEGAQSKVPVLSITGEDVAAFADDIIKEVANTWIAERGAKLNKKIADYKAGHKHV